MKYWFAVIAIATAFAVNGQVANGRGSRPLAVLLDGQYTFAYRDSLTPIRKAPKFQKVYNVPRTQFFVVRNRRFGVISTSFDTILPLVYDTIYYENRVRVSKRGNQFDFFNGSEEFRVSIQADSVKDDHERGWIVYLAGKQGYLTRDLKDHIAAQYDLLRRHKSVLYTMRGDRFGLVNLTGEEIFPPDYSEVIQYNDSVFRARMGNRHYYSNLAGNSFSVEVGTRVLFSKWGYHRRMTEEDTALYKGVTDLLVGDGKYENYYPLSKELIAVKKGDSAYLMDSAMMPVLRKGYHDIVISVTGNYIVKIDDHYGVVTPTDSILVPMSYSYISDIRYTGYNGESYTGYLLYLKGNEGIARADGSVILKPVQAGIRPTGFGNILVNHGKSFGMFNIDGEKVVNVTHKYWKQVYPKLIRFEASKRFTYATPKKIIASIKDRNYLGNDVLKSYRKNHLKIFEFDSVGGIADEYTYENISSVPVIEPPITEVKGKRPEQSSLKNTAVHYQLDMMTGQYGVYDRTYGKWKVFPCYDHIEGTVGMRFDSISYQIDGFKLYSEFAVDRVPVQAGKGYVPTAFADDLSGGCGSASAARIEKNGRWNGYTSSWLNKGNVTFIKGCSERKTIYYTEGKLIFTDHRYEESADDFFDRFNEVHQLRPADQYSAEKILAGDMGIRPVGGNWRIYHDPFTDQDQHFNGKRRWSKTDLFDGVGARFYRGPYQGVINYKGEVVVPPVFLEMNEDNRYGDFQGKRLVQRYNYINIRNKEMLLDTLFNLTDYDGFTLIMGSGNKKGLVNTNLDTLIKPGYHSLVRLSPNVFKAEINDKGAIRLVDSVGNTLTRKGFVSSPLSRGMTMTYKLDSMELYNELGVPVLLLVGGYEFQEEKDGFLRFEFEDNIKYYNQKGEEVYTHKIGERIKFLNGGFLQIKKNKGYKFFDLNAKKMIKGTSEKTARQTAAGQLVLRNSKGYYIVSEGVRKKGQYQRLIPICQGLFFSRFDRDWYLMNDSGEQLMKVGLREYEEYGDVVQLYDEEGEKVFYNVKDERLCIDNGYQLFEPIRNGLGWAYDPQSRKKVIVDADLNKRCELDFDDVSLTESDDFAFRKGKFWGVANVQGEVLIEPEYWGMQKSRLNDWWRIQDFPREGVQGYGRSVRVPFIYDCVEWYDVQTYQVEKEGRIGYVSTSKYISGEPKVIWPLRK